MEKVYITCQDLLINSESHFTHIKSTFPIHQLNFRGTLSRKNKSLKLKKRNP